MNKQELIRKVKALEGYNSAFTRDYEIGHDECMDKAVLLIEQLDEQHKVKVPQVVFKFLDDNEQLSKQEKLAYLIRSKDGDQFYLTEMLPCDGIITDSDGDELFSWVEKQSHETLLNIWKYGYEIEKPRYRVNIGGLYLKEPLGDTNDFTIAMTWNEEYAYPFDSWNMAREHISELGGTIEKV